ncbi:MAG: helix-turn-helix transcriptional regulator, partial [Oscillospiraceae bacterium]|nr:helix-turn-helix transcriptional regulator [Oscillospiraceae bacterium]
PTRITYFSLLLNLGYAVSVLGIGLLVLYGMPAAAPALRHTAEFLGVLSGCAIYAAIFAKLRNSLQMTWSVVFSGFFLAMFLHALWPDSKPLTVFAAFLIGLSMVMGLLNMFFNVGVVGKKYRMRSHLVLTMCCSTVGGGLIVVLGNFSYLFPARELSVTAMAVSGLMVVGYFVSAPILSRNYFMEDWVEDSEYVEVGLAAQIRQEQAQAALLASQKPPAYLFEDFMARAKTLTPTEMIILGHYAGGKKTDEILALMFIAPSTLKNHNTNIFRKLQVSNRDELMVYINLMRRCEMLQALLPNSE